MTHSFVLSIFLDFYRLLSIFNGEFLAFLNSISAKKFCIGDENYVPKYPLRSKLCFYCDNIRSFSAPVAKLRTIILNTSPVVGFGRHGSCIDYVYLKKKETTSKSNFLLFTLTGHSLLYAA